ncbi:hypothetical protein RD792_012254 [Penstemon davidsonii]|uniref:Alcohol dehydrogenase n=1 Tax=Penstemon davidsonii TaxID=160366 RepID=A0ABR0CWR6_9LAMI|nr:hypothetical protein RD792_012254 [Penstemon davidsonii]
MAEKQECSKTAGKPIRCRAAVARKSMEPLVIEEVIVAPPKAYEVRIKVICTSLCYSDITFWKRNEPGFYPIILGHESVGVVESVGDGVDEFKEGDIVIPQWMAECKECDTCTSNKTNICSKFPFSISTFSRRDGTSRFTDLNGQTLNHFLYVSSFSEYTVVDIVHLTKLDVSIPPNKACLLSCGVSTGIGAAWRAADVESGSTVAIFGLGVIGFAVAEGSRLRGAERIIGVDLNPEKFEIGKKFGITDFIDARNCKDKSVSQIINEMTDGGADYCFECAGSTDAMQEAFNSCRRGWGKTIVLGVEKPNQKLSLDSLVVLHSGKTLMGSLFGGSKPKTDIPLLAQSYMNKELQLDCFITHEMKLEDINKAFELLIQGKCHRCVMWMD